jgi:PAS domain S-box-containing protein
VEAQRRGKLHRSSPRLAPASSLWLGHAGRPLDPDPARRLEHDCDRLLAMASRMARLGAWTVVLDDESVRLSDEACTIHGLPTGSTLKMDAAIDLYAPDSRPLITAALAACVGAGTAYDLECEIRTSTGRVVPVRVIGEAVRGSNGQVEGIQGVIQDISPLREAQANAERLDARLARTLESVTDAFYTLDREWRFTFVNPEAERIQQRTRTQMLGRSVWDVFPEAVGSVFDVQFRKAVETGEAAIFESYYPPLDLWVAVRAFPSDDGLAVYFLDISARRAAEQALVASEQRYRGLFERAGDALLIADDAGRFIDVNPAAGRLLGVAPENAIGHTMAEFAVAADLEPDVAIALTPFLAAGDTGDHVRIRRPDGTTRDAQRVSTAHSTSGQHLSVLRDDTDRLAAEVSLSAAVSALRLSEDRFRAALDTVALHALILDTEGRLLFVNRHLLARTGWTDEDLIGSNVFSWLDSDNEPAVSPEAYETGMTSDVFVDHIESTWRTKSGDRVLIAWNNSAIRDDSGRIVAVAAVGEDVTARREAEATQARLVAAIGQAAESIMVTDVIGRVVYANPAFEQMSGIPVAEVMGKEPRTVVTGPGSAQAYPRISRRLRSGRPWSGEWDLARRDGSLYREAVTMSPVRAAGGEIVNFVRVARDVTRFHEIQASLASSTRGREAFAHALARLQQRDTLEETGQDITDAVSELRGVDVAVLVTFEAGGDVMVLAATGPAGHPFVVGRSTSAAAATYVIDRARLGAWTEGPDSALLARPASLGAVLGVKGVACAPIDNGDGPIGLIVLGSLDVKAADRMDDLLPAAIEFAAAARSLIAAPLAVRAAQHASRRRIEGIISAQAFEPVFQPIVRLATGEPVGYEALTRFHDGTRPDLVFAEAVIADVGLDLEAVTLASALTAAQDLPAGAWLSVNVSAAMILEAKRLARILERRTCPIVLEVTEHDSIADYGVVRAAIALLGADVRVAVDDAGAGVANFSHIVSLRPDFVKIDVGLVRGVNHDLTRQALIVGLRHFARATNGWLIAEGVETDEERQTLLGLDLELGQGFLFGRPASAATWKRPAGSDAHQHRSAPTP